MALQVHKSSLAGGFRTRTGYRLTGTGSLKFGGLLIAGSATGLGGGTSVSKLLAAGCWLLTGYRHWFLTTLDLDWKF